MRPVHISIAMKMTLRELLIKENTMKRYLALFCILLVVGFTVFGQSLPGKVRLAQSYAGTAPPGSISGSLAGDIYVDTTNHVQYICNAPSGPCTSVSTSGWMSVSVGSSFTGGIVSPLPPPASGWSWVNQGGATVNTVDSALCMNIPDNGSLNWRLRIRAISGTYTITAHLRYNSQSSSSQTGGIYLYDSGSGKLEGLELLTQTGPSQTFRVQTANSTTSANTTLATLGIFAPFYNFQGVLSLQVIEDGTHRTWKYSVDYGLNWKQIYQEASGTFLTPDNFGFGGVSQVNDPQHFVDLSLLSLAGA